MIVAKFIKNKSFDATKALARARADADAFEAVIAADAVGAWKTYEDFVRARLRHGTRFPQYEDLGVELEAHLNWIKAEEKAGYGAEWVESKAALTRLLEIWNAS